MEHVPGNTRMYLNADFTIEKTSEKLRFLEEYLKEICKFISSDPGLFPVSH